LDARGKQRQHGGIEGVRLGQAPDRLGKVAHLPRIDHGDRHARERERGHDVGFIAAGRFEHHQRRGELLDMRDQGLAPGLVVRKPRRRRGRIHRHIEMGFGDVNTNVTGGRHPAISSRTRPTLRDAGSNPGHLYGLWRRAKERRARATNGMNLPRAGTGYGARDERPLRYKGGFRDMPP
jgi:hypothetical protein